MCTGALGRCRETLPRRVWLGFLVSALSGLLVLIAFTSGAARATTRAARAVGVAPGPAAAHRSQNDPSANPAAQAFATVTKTLVLINNTLVQGNFPVPNLLYPLAVAFDDAAHSAYVVGESDGPDVMAIVNLSTGMWNRTVVLGPPLPSASNHHQGIVFDGANGHLYVTNADTDTVTVVDAVSGSLLKAIYLGSGTNPEGIAYDSTNGRLYVADSGAGLVTVIDGATDLAIGNVTVGMNPLGMAFDAANGYVYATNSGSDNVSVINGATDTLVTTIGLAAVPEGIAYDAANKQLYIAQPYQGNVSVIDGSKNAVVGAIVVGPGAYPWTVAYSAASGDLYVANDTSHSARALFEAGSVFVINGKTDTFAGSVVVGGQPSWLSVDPGSGNVYVPNALSENVTVIVVASNLAAGSIRVGTAPALGAYDEADLRVYISNPYGRSVFTVDGRTDRVLHETFVGPSSLPAGMAYDPATGDVYVSDAVLGDVVVMDASSGILTARIPLGSNARPQGVAYDPGNGYLYVADSGTRTVSVIDGATNRIVANVTVGVTPFAIAVDDANGDLYVANGGPMGSGSHTVSVINGTTDQVIATISFFASSMLNGIAYDSANGCLYVIQTDVGDVTVIDGATNTVAGVIPLGFSALPTAVAFNAADRDLYEANALGNNVTVINGTTNSVAGAIDVGYAPSGVVAASAHVYVSNDGSISVLATGAPETYPVTFTETGLPPGASWSVNLGGVAHTSTTNRIAFSEPNGTYSFAVTTVSGYAANPSSGPLTVNGVAIGTTITFTLVPTYSLTFTETGLRSGTSWSVTLAGATQTATTSAIVFTEPNGTYSFSIGQVPGYVANRSSGPVTVIGTSVTVPTTFTSVPPTLHTVTFTESGLSPSTYWSVSLGGNQSSSTGTTIVLYAPNGTYTFSVAPVQDYTSSPSSGQIVVNGPVSKAITFTPVPMLTITSYTASPENITLGESLTLTAVTANGTGVLTYVYVGLPPGCASANAASLTCTPTQAGTFGTQVIVSDAAGHTDTAVTTIQVNPGPTLLGLPLAVAYALFAAIAVIVAVLVAIILVWRRRRRETPPETPPPEPPLNPPEP